MWSIVRSVFDDISIAAGDKEIHNTWLYQGQIRRYKTLLVINLIVHWRQFVGVGSFYIQHVIKLSKFAGWIYCSFLHE